MNVKFVSIILIFVLISCKQSIKQDSNDRKTFIQSIDSLDRKEANNVDKNLDWTDLKKYIGTSSKDTDFFQNPIIKKELKRILGSDLKLYENHISLSGSGEIEYKYGLIYGDVSQEHVGGYSSLFFVNIRDKKMYLFWLTEQVRDKNYKIYGDKPVPANVLNIIEQEMNIEWGHVANFVINGDSINIISK